MGAAAIVTLECLVELPRRFAMVFVEFVEQSLELPGTLAAAPIDRYAFGVFHVVERLGRHDLKQCTAVGATILCNSLPRKHELAQSNSWAVFLAPQVELPPH